MKIIEKNEGKKINYNLTGTKLDFADGALTLDLARYQQDDPVTRDITVTPEINAFIEAAVKELDLAEKNAIGEIGKIFSDAEQTPQN